MFHVKHFKRLESFCQEHHLIYDGEKDKLFQQFCEALLECNRSMNLTAVTETDEVEVKHFIDSIAAIPLIDRLSGIITDDLSNRIEKDAKQPGRCETVASMDGADSSKRLALQENMDITDERNCLSIKLVDIGTGAGFPGIPLGIMLPSMRFTLVDSLNKRIQFLQKFIYDAKLPNITAIQSRAEEIGQSPYRESFDFCVSRAVADLSVLLEYCLPVVKVGGYAILYKSGNYQRELNAAATAVKTLGGCVEGIEEFRLPNTDYQRSLIVIRKEKATPIKYPRRPGKPSKSPISNH